MQCDNKGVLHVCSVVAASKVIFAAQAPCTRSKQCASYAAVYALAGSYSVSALSLLVSCVRQHMGVRCLS